MILPLLSITCSHLFYAVVWLRPNLVKNIGVEGVIGVSVGMRAFQFLTTSIMMKNYIINLNFFTSKLFLILIGQLLNLTVYKKLGMEGVYYGSKFNRKLPMITSFPYNVMSNPQYVGCVLTQYGTFLFYPYHQMAILTFYSVMCYIVTTEIEKMTVKST